MSRLSKAFRSVARSPLLPIAVSAFSPGAGAVVSAFQNSQRGKERPVEEMSPMDWPGSPRVQLARSPLQLIAEEIIGHLPPRALMPGFPILGSIATAVEESQAEEVFDEDDEEEDDE